jgi:hypothetical protein
MLLYPCGVWRYAHGGWATVEMELLLVAGGGGAAHRGAPMVGAEGGGWRSSYDPFNKARCLSRSGCCRSGSIPSWPPWWWRRGADPRSRHLLQIDGDVVAVVLLEDEVFSLASSSLGDQSRLPCPAPKSHGRQATLVQEINLLRRPSSISRWSSP